MTIKAKLVGLGILVAVAVVGLLALNQYSNSVSDGVRQKTLAADEENQLRQSQVLALRQFMNKLTSINVNAMDMIIEKDSGDVEAELMAEMTENADFIMNALPQLDEIADTEQEKKNAEEIKKRVTEVVDMVRNRLTAIIREKGKVLGQVEADFAAIDDELDEVGDAVGDLLDKLEHAEEGETEASDAYVNARQDVLRVHGNLMLTAMDAIIDREDGKISDDRMAAFQDMDKQLKDLLPVLVEEAPTPEAKKIARQLSTDLPRLLGLCTGKLNDLIVRGTAERNKAAEQFEQFDGEIDSDLGDIYAELDAMEASVVNEMDETREAVAAIRTQGDQAISFAEWVNLLVLIGFGVVMVGSFAYIARGILTGIHVVREHILRYSQGWVEPIDELRGQVQSISQSRDECGDMIRAAETLREYLERNIVVANSIADGDLRVDIELASDKDMFGMAFEEMIEGLSEAIAQVFSAVNEITYGAGQLSSASQLLSQNATEQAASLEEVNASMTQIGGQVTENAGHATKANDLSGQARRSASDGGSRMETMVNAMSGITKNSEEIQKVIRVIDDIAFQTNLLALNAAVEAARAGQHGKGFAVVAEEVRNLAARSAKAAQETADLIEGSNRRIEEGAEIANLTAEALTQINDQINQAAELVSGIAAASQEQAASMKQVTLGLGQIDLVTQENTANAEETASAAEEMAQTGEQLKLTMDRFQLRDKYSVKSGGGARMQELERNLKQKRGQFGAAPATRQSAPSRDDNSHSGWESHESREAITL